MSTQKGFSYLELLTTLAIATIVTVIAIPSASAWIQKQQTETSVHALLHALALARNEAVTRRQRVSVVNNGQWENGWRVFVDTDSNASFGDNDELLYQQPPLSGVRIRGNSPVARLLTYRSDGQSVLPNNGFQAGTLLFCPTDGRIAPYKLVISKGGRPRIERLSPAANECTAPSS